MKTSAGIQALNALCRLMTGADFMLADIAKAEQVGDPICIASKHSDMVKEALAKIEALNLNFRICMVDTEDGETPALAFSPGSHP